MATISAILRAAQTLYLWLLLIGALAFLFPNMGLGRKLFEMYDPNAVFKLAFGLLFVGLLMGQARTAVITRRQAALAQALVRQRGNTNEDAIRILIAALSSDEPRVIEQAHKELRRLTARDLGTDPAPWKAWLKSQEQGSSPPKEPSDSAP